MVKESRQVRRQRERLAKKKTEHLVTHEVYFIPMKRKSRKGVEYTYYKKVTDIKGLNKNAHTKNNSKDIPNTSRDIKRPNGRKGKK